MQYITSKCYECSFFIKEPNTIGGTAECKKYKEIDRKIFFEGKQCKDFKKKGQRVRK